MLLARPVLALAILTGGCAVARTAAAASPPQTPPPATARRQPESPEHVVAERVPVAYHDVRALASVLKDIFDVRPDRGDVRAILSDSRDAALIVFATPAGHAGIRRVLDRLLTSTGS